MTRHARRIFPSLLAVCVVTAAGQTSHPVLPPLPAPQGAPQAGPATDAPYNPTAILPGGVVVPLYASNSPYLDHRRIREPESYAMNASVPGRIQSIVNIHNPSIEFHAADAGMNTGTTVILIPGGGHRFLNVGTEGADFVPFFYQYGVNTVILRNRLHSDGYDVDKDEVRDTLQAIRLVRAHAADWHLDPNRIGMMGFSAGGELAANAAVRYDDFDKQNDGADDPLAGRSSRPDFVTLIYPGPTPFAPGKTPPNPLPHNLPPSFITSAGSDDQVHAVWADQYFAAMLAQHVPDLEIHIYAEGRHPGEVLRDGSHMTGGLSDKQGTPFGTWQLRFIDWFRELGFLNKPGVKTKAASDLDFYLSHPVQENK